jgi:hypothetical protein
MLHMDMPSSDLRVKQQRWSSLTVDLKEYQKQATDWEAVLGIVKFCC